MRATSVLLAAFAVLVAAPIATAAPCTTDLTAVCDLADDWEFDRLFGDYADIGLLFVALTAAVALLVVLTWALTRGATTPKIRALPRDPTVEVEPGQTIQLLADVENRRRRQSTDIRVDWARVTPGWEAEAFASVVHRDDFTAPQLLDDEDHPLHLSSMERGAHRATVAVQLTAPESVAFDETVDFNLRLTPVTNGVPRRGSSKKIRFTVLLGTRQAAVRIENVAHQPTKIQVGKKVHTQARVLNSGGGSARDVGVDFLLNDERVERRILPTLGPHEEALVEFDWVAQAGENRVRIALA